MSLSSPRIAKDVDWHSAFGHIQRSVLGTLVMVLGLCIIVAMISYDSTDPSLNTATERAVPNNLLGLGGAWLADLMWQALGLAGGLLGMTCVIWGTRLIAGLQTGFWAGRIMCLLLATVSASAALSILPASESLPHPALGGTIGAGILHMIQGWLILFSGSPAGINLLALTLGFLALSFWVVASGIRALEWAFGLGIAGHALLRGLKGIIAIGHLALNRLHRARDQALHVFDDEDTPESDADAVSHSNARTASTKESLRIIHPDKAKAKAKTNKSTDHRPAKQPGLPLDGHHPWELPPLDVLQDPPLPLAQDQLDDAALRRNAELLNNVLSDFNVQGDIISIHPGPVVTLYELEPAPGIKSSRVIGLSDDIARSMSAISVRAAVVPGRNVIGIELPNKRRQTVYLRDVLTSKAFQQDKGKLSLVLGKDIGGQPIVADLARMPHLLVAGTTGSGKSVAVNTMILSLLYRLSPEQCRFIMIDPKMLELSVYDDIPHLLAPVVTEPGKAVVALKWAVAEMENRYRAMSKLGVRNIEGYNIRLAEAVAKGEILTRKVQTGFDPETGKPVYEEQPFDMNPLPYIVIVVDEFADLMLVAGKDVEAAIQRLAQMARAAGIHLIMATQRPSVDVITGVIKANFPTRISFQVTSKIDSRTILGEGGAEQLLGMGDMLYMASGGRVTRVHGPFVSDQEVESVVDFLRNQREPDYSATTGRSGELFEDLDQTLGGAGASMNTGADEFYDQAVALVAKEGKASTSFIQRYFQIGYNRAARIIEEMERQGVIGPANAVGKREVLVGDHSVQNRSRS